MRVEIMNISASNRTDLIAELSSVDISVPLRSCGRTKEHCERWSICHWLTAFNELTFPIKLTHRDKPDFHLVTNNLEIGIEHTEAIPEDYAHASAISEKTEDETVVDMSLFKWGQKRRPQEIYEIAKSTKLTGPGWEGDSPEIQWAVAMSEIIKHKTSLLRKDDFDKFSRNYLLIYDNLPLPSLDYSKGLDFLREALEQYWNEILIFNITFIQTDALLMLVEKEEIRSFPSNNIW
ncbi:MAG: hypothetical protein K9N21_03975 [Deltaproteobacteria bacterium]|nr:hypothetical protein [Deltaproteobacteria bacterium]